MDCSNNCIDDNPPAVDAMLFGGDYETSLFSSDEAGFFLSSGDFDGDDVDDIAASSLTHRFVYMVSLNDTDGDGDPNIRDDDDDGDGYFDIQEDFNTDGVLDPGESDPLIQNSDITVEFTQPIVDPFLLDCTDTVEIEVEVINSSLVLRPRRSSTAGRSTRNHAAVLGTAGVPLRCGVRRPSTRYRSSTAGDSRSPPIARSRSTAPHPLPTPLAPTERIVVRFLVEANRPLEFVIPVTQDDIEALVQLQPPWDPTSLDFPHDAGISSPRSATHAIDLQLPVLAGLIATPRAPSKASADRDGGPYLDPLDIIDYTITVTNNGTFQATNFALRDQIPTYTDLIPGSLTTDRGTVDESDPTDIEVDFVDLPIGVTATVNVQRDRR